VALGYPELGYPESEQSGGGHPKNGDVSALGDGHLVDPRIAYFTGERPVSALWASWYEISDIVPFSAKRLWAELCEQGVVDLGI
jgi:hypothetical protein